MRARLALLLAAILPATALALEYQNSAIERYSDAPFSRAEEAGISVLTNLGAVGGYPDGTFRPGRVLNRAEFLKIVIASHPTMAANIETVVPWTCFPDVVPGQWFTPYVCLAQREGIVRGYPDGLFRPEQTVNYAEAVKMLVGVYGFSPEAADGDTWYDPYFRVARERGVLLPGVVGADAFLTRGQMARLAAAFRAEKDGELQEYRDLEAGIRSSASSASSSSSNVSSSVASSASSTSSVAPSQEKPDYPAVSHILLLGSVTPPLFDGTFTTPDAGAVVRLADFKLRREIKSLDHLELVDEDGTVVLQLKLATANNADKKLWRGEDGSGNYVLPQNTPTRLGIRAVLKPRGEGISGELVEVDDWSITTLGDNSISRNLVPQDMHSPLHQTAQARINGITVTSNEPETGTLQSGKQAKIGSFTFSGSALPGTRLLIDGLTVRYGAIGIKLSNIRIGDGSDVNSGSCSMDAAVPEYFTCDAIPAALEEITGDGRTLGIYATPTILSTSQQPMLQITLDAAGMPGTHGAVRWTDGTGIFNWVDLLGSPLAVGTEWTVEK